MDSREVFLHLLHVPHWETTIWIQGQCFCIFFMFLTGRRPYGFKESVFVLEVVLRRGMYCLEDMAERPGRLQIYMEQSEADEVNRTSNE